MISKNINYFDWCDIRKEICKEMNIKEGDFRDYHSVIGGDYKDLWHEWMHYFSEVYNDTIIPIEMGEMIESKISWIKDDKKDWLEPFVNAVYKVWEDNNIEYVKYSW